MGGRLMPAGWLHYSGKRYPLADNCPTGRSRIGRGFHPKKVRRG